MANHRPNQEVRVRSSSSVNNNIQTTQEQPQVNDPNPVIQANNPHTNLKSDDPFLYYSNDIIRMKTLRLEEVPDEASSSAEEEDQQANCFRKTRISFELHQSVFFDEIADAIFADNGLDTYDISLASLFEELLNPNTSFRNE